MDIWHCLCIPRFPCLSPKHPSQTLPNPLTNTTPAIAWSRISDLNSPSQYARQRRPSCLSIPCEMSQYLKRRSFLQLSRARPSHERLRFFYLRSHRYDSRLFPKLERGHPNQILTIRLITIIPLHETYEHKYPIKVCTDSSKAAPVRSGSRWPSSFTRI